MTLEYYTEQKIRLPHTGRQIIGQMRGDELIVYQAFNPNIAAYAVQHQAFGGKHYSFSRMSWIKPGFLWMMYRAGWAFKEHQQRILAISLPMIHFETILKAATISSYDAAIFPTPEDWKCELEQTEVRLQWDPDHDPYGEKQSRKAIQLGLKGDILRKFCTEWVTGIEDITPFVHEQFHYVQKRQLEKVKVPYEDVISIDNTEINKRLGIQS